MRFEAKYKIFLSRKCIWKYRLGNGGHFVQGGDELMVNEIYSAIWYHWDILNFKALHQFWNSDKCLLPVRRQAITRADANLLSFGLLGNSLVKWMENMKNFLPEECWKCLQIGRSVAAPSSGSNLTLNVRRPSYLGLTRSISWLLMPWLLTSPGHQQPW